LIQSICNFAYQNGISTLALVSLVNLITSPDLLDQASRAALIKGLYPAGKVPSDVVCTIVSSLGQGQPKPSPSTQNLLLRWLVLVYEVLEDPATLVKLYNVLFNLLDMISIRSDSPRSLYERSDDTAGPFYVTCSRL
jgi:centromere protein I